MKIIKDINLTKNLIIGSQEYQQGLLIKKI